MLKKISILFVMIMMIVPTIKITNAQSTGVTFQGEAEKFVLVNSEDGDLFSDFKDIYPGETKKQTITLSNKDYRELRFYMSAKVLDAFGNDIADSMVYDIDFLVNGQSVFAGMIGGQDEVGLKAMEDNFLIATLAQDEEATLDALIEADVDVKDIETQEDGTIEITGEPTDLYKIKSAIEAACPSAEFDVEEITTLPQEYIELSGEDLELFQRLLRLLDECDDVDKVFHNVSNV